MDTKQDMETRAVKYDGDKVHGYSLIPANALQEMARLYTYGATKYSPDNWKKGLSYRRCYDAIMRHLHAWLEGEDIDQENTCHHLASVAFYCFAIIFFHHAFTYHKFDDRGNNDGNTPRAT